MPLAVPQTITVSLDDAVVDALASAFDGERDKLASEFAQYAVDGFTAWFQGDDRFRSLTEQYVTWVEALCERLGLPDAPSFDLLYGTFNLPYGQAQYISRVIADRTQSTWRPRAEGRLKDDLRPALAAALEATKSTTGGKWDARKAIPFKTTRLAAIELRRACDRVWRGHNEFEYPTPKGGMGDQRSFEMPAASLILLCQFLGVTLDNDKA